MKPKVNIRKLVKHLKTWKPMPEQEADMKSYLKSKVKEVAERFDSEKVLDKMANDFFNVKPQEDCFKGGLRNEKKEVEKKLIIAGCYGCDKLGSCKKIPSTCGIPRYEKPKQTQEIEVEITKSILNFCDYYIIEPNLKIKVGETRKAKLIFME